MLKTTRFCLMMAVLIMALGGFQTVSGQTIEGPEVRIDKKMRVNGKMTITLPDNPTTGYQWQVEYDKEYLDFLGKEYRSHQKPGQKLVGVGGTSFFTFRALKPGRTKIIMKHQRPWEPRPYSVETYNVLID